MENYDHSFNERCSKIPRGVWQIIRSGGVRISRLSARIVHPRKTVYCAQRRLFGLQMRKSIPAMIRMQLEFAKFAMLPSETYAC